ncbi:MAG: trypsin-like peptidase domain-containing protein [Candidatus Sungbacteria bacterium]|nr:trypsin-like peptidase domain-containing protein [Candidatus Sungbacteria bacterium]
MPHSPYEERIIKMVEHAMPSVVSIVVGKDYEAILRERPYELMAQHGDHLDLPPPEEDLPHTKGGKVRVGGGSGFIVGSAGLILTNKHVVHDADAEYLITTASEETYPAHVIARDPLNDVAILKIQADGLPTLPLGNSNSIRLGQTVLAVGTALGEFQNTVSSGIVSGLSRFITAFTDADGHSERLRGLIQTDAAINPGNSGGPLVNLDGEAIGINSAVVFGAQNIGFAIPINKAKQDLTEVEKHGRIRRPFLGVRYILLNPMLQKRFRLPIDHGAFVLREGMPAEAPAIIPGSSAHRAGIQEMDIITEFNHKIIDGDKNGLEGILEEVAIGQSVAVKIIRDGAEQTLTLVAEERHI